jgi:MYXO-CTERM domain-containing protein
MQRGGAVSNDRAHTWARVAGVCAALALGACGPMQATDLSTSTEESIHEILGGTVDTTTEAVQALVHTMNASSSNVCTGTTIAKVGASGIFLTAAHCVAVTDGMGRLAVPLKIAAPNELFIVPGPDWDASLAQGLYYGVVDVQAHPSFDGNVRSPYDIAVVRYVGTIATSPVIPAITPEEDKLAVGSPITLVGFGKTEMTGANSQRRRVDRPIEQLTSQQFTYDQRDSKGACQGDSGGPALVQTPGGLRVAGVTSFGDPDCTTAGASVRVSPYTSFIQSFVSKAPAMLDCPECTLAVVGPGNPCVASSATCSNPDTSCGKYLACAAACTTQSCVNTCGTRQAAGAAAYNDMLKCQCGNACKTICASNPTCVAVGGGTTTPTMPTMPTTPKPGGPACGGLTDARPDCASCIKSTCCGEASACAADAACAACLTSSTVACSSNAAFSNLTTCLATCPACSGSAPQLPPDGGAAGAPPGQTGGGGIGGDGGGGCGCSAGGPAPVTSLAPLAAFALLFARRRRVR